MKHLIAVRSRQALPGLDETLEHVAPGTALLREPALERDAWHVFHRQHDMAAALLDVVDGNDVWMAQPGHRPRLAEQQVLGLDVEHRRVEARERDFSAEP